MQGAFSLSAGKPEFMHIDQQKVIVRAASKYLKAVLYTGSGQCLTIFNDTMRIIPEFRGSGFTEGNCLGSDNMGQGTAHGKGAAVIQRIGKFGS
jgi:hypothetical protein